MDLMMTMGRLRLLVMPFRCSLLVEVEDESDEEEGEEEESVEAELSKWCLHFI